jgi:hypothetical protein
VNGGGKFAIMNPTYTMEGALAMWEVGPLRWCTKLTYFVVMVYACVCVDAVIDTRDLSVWRERGKTPRIPLSLHATELDVVRLLKTIVHPPHDTMDPAVFSGITGIPASSNRTVGGDHDEHLGHNHDDDDDDNEDCQRSGEEAEEDQEDYHEDGDTNNYNSDWEGGVESYYSGEEAHHAQLEYNEDEGNDNTDNISNNKGNGAQTQSATQLARRKQQQQGKRRREARGRAYTRPGLMVSGDVVWSHHYPNAPAASTTSNSTSTTPTFSNKNNSHNNNTLQLHLRTRLTNFFHFSYTFTLVQESPAESCRLVADQLVRPLFFVTNALADIATSNPTTIGGAGAAVGGGMKTTLRLLAARPVQPLHKLATALWTGLLSGEWRSTDQHHHSAAIPIDITPTKSPTKLNTDDAAAACLEEEEEEVKRDAEHQINAKTYSSIKQEEHWIAAGGGVIVKPEVLDNGSYHVSPSPSLSPSPPLLQPPQHHRNLRSNRGDSSLTTKSHRHQPLSLSYDDDQQSPSTLAPSSGNTQRLPSAMSACSDLDFESSASAPPPDNLGADPELEDGEERRRKDELKRKAEREKDKHHTKSNKRKKFFV